MYLRNYGLRKTLLYQRLKSPISENPLKKNMENARKSVEIWIKAPLPYLAIPAKAIDLQKVSVSDMENLKTVS